MPPLNLNLRALSLSTSTSTTLSRRHPQLQPRQETTYPTINVDTNSSPYTNDSSSLPIGGIIAIVFGVLVLLGIISLCIRQAARNRPAPPRPKLPPPPAWRSHRDRAVAVDVDVLEPPPAYRAGDGPGGGPVGVGVPVQVLEPVYGGSGSEGLKREKDGEPAGGQMVAIGHI
jgi:hypothetical protein